MIPTESKQTAIHIPRSLGRVIVSAPITSCFSACPPGFKGGITNLRRSPAADLYILPLQAPKPNLLSVWARDHAWLRFPSVRCYGCPTPATTPRRRYMGVCMYARHRTHKLIAPPFRHDHSSTKTTNPPLPLAQIAAPISLQQAPFSPSRHTTHTPAAQESNTR